MLTVAWPSAIARKAQIWRILDLSGMTKSVRESRNFTRAGYIYLDGNRVLGLKDMVAVGKLFTLEIRFPNGKIVSSEIRLVHRHFTVRSSRTNLPTSYNYRG